MMHIPNVFKPNKYPLALAFSPASNPVDAMEAVGLTVLPSFDGEASSGYAEMNLSSDDRTIPRKYAGSEVSVNREMSELVDSSIYN
jgi:hypothetical protein